MLDFSTRGPSSKADLINQGHFARHIQGLRKDYRRRRDCVLQAFAKAFGESFRFRQRRGGLHLVADVPASLPAAEVERWAAQHGICVWDLSAFYTEAKPPNALHLGFAAVREPEIWPSVQRLREAIADLL